MRGLQQGNLGGARGAASHACRTRYTPAISWLCSPPMSIADRDYLLRMIQRVAQAIAAALGKRAEGQPDEGLALLERARAEIFGVIRSALDAVDPASVNSMLSEADKVRAYARFLAVEADLRDDRGEARAAASARRRALAVLLEMAAARAGELGAEDREAIAALAAKVDAARLTDRQRATLSGLGGAAPGAAT